MAACTAFSGLSSFRSLGCGSWGKRFSSGSDHTLGPLGPLGFRVSYSYTTTQSKILSRPEAQLKPAMGFRGLSKFGCCASRCAVLLGSPAAAIRPASRPAGKYYSNFLSWDLTVDASSRGPDRHQSSLWMCDFWDCRVSVVPLEGCGELQDLRSSNMKPPTPKASSFGR